MTFVTALGLVAAVCTTLAFLPQAIKVIKSRQTSDISLAMYAILTFGISLWLVYGILVKDLPIIAANAVTFVFAAIILGMKIKYK